MNKNIPKLPELTEEYKQQQHQAVLDAEVIYEFELLKEPKVEISLIIFFSIVSLFTFWFVYLDVEFLWAVVILNLMVWGTYLSSGNPQIEQKVTITKKGIILSELELIPEGFYVALRSTGFIAAALCVIAVIFLGPMMLVGAGAGALMGFQMTGAQRKAKVKVKPFCGSIDYTLTFIKASGFKNGLLDYIYKPRDEDDELPCEQRNFYSFSFSTTPEGHKIIAKEINKFLNISKINDHTHL
ncbi:hypothetical protein BS333_20600 [Vibrio azureus]|uniref:Uncharacterized protein n=2 Tax=Vibrio azureus TaxID=512649 RepID=U3AT40_9VIBR|nr:hypothetical protein [Vibrio azureus]AUI88688.1 hypothetical protein BS333_20600 [Vibrio azureus]GAD76930.1 hypothetical protein VAZ01S_056_00120 [Vibrio azureus NBRC 104587]